MLDIIVLVWLASFRFHLHFCIFVYWTRKKKSKQNWVFFFLLLSFCFLTCRTQLSLWQPRRPWPRYLNMCFEDFRRKWGFSHLLLTKLGLVSARVGRRGQGEWAVARLPLGASQVGSSLQKQHFYTLGFFWRVCFPVKNPGWTGTPSHAPTLLRDSAWAAPSSLSPQGSSFRRMYCFCLWFHCDLSVMMVLYLFHYFVFVFISITCIDRECLHFLFIFMPPVTDALHGPQWVYEWMMSVSQCFLLEFLVEYSQAFLYWVLFLCSNL